MSDIKYFTIYGERCSGTNYLEELIINNFNLDLTWEFGFKHFFMANEFKNSQKENETLFIGIVRNPIDWLHSFYSSPHHVPKINTLLKNFLFNTFVSVHTDGTMIEQSYKNIFELRKSKNNYLLNVMPTKVKNYVLIRYEDLASTPDVVLNQIKNKFNIPLKSGTNDITKVDYYKKLKDKKYEPRKTRFLIRNVNIIKANLDREQERSLNYLI